MASQTEKRIHELRLRPLYDYIDNDRASSAIRAADKILKKNPTDTAVKVVKALAYFRMNKDNEGLSILEALDVDGARHDELSLQAFVQCYKEVNLPRNICTLYERVVEWNATEQNLTILFLAYVRVQNYTKQLGIVQRLWKDFSKHDYFYWYMITLVMQARAFPDKTKLSYAVANKSIQSFVEKNGYRNLFVLEIHLLVLEGLGNYKEAAKLLHEHKDILSAKPEAFVRQQELELLVRSEEWDAVERCSVNAVKVNGDDWKSWSTYMDLIITLLRKSEIGEEIATKFASDFMQLIHDKLNTQKILQRGPYLARLEMLSRLKISGIENMKLTEQLGNISENLSDYIRMFHKKPCCYVDIEKYLNFVQDDEEWFKKVNKNLSELYASYKNQNNGEQLKQSAIQVTWENSGRVILLQEKIGLRLRRSTYANRKDKFSMIAKLLDHVEELTNLSYTMKESSGLEQCSGELILMCISSLWKDWNDKKDSQWLSITEAALICEQALKVVKHDYTSKLALCRFYSHIGVIDRCRDLYVNLDIKSVQQETLGYIIFHQYELCGRYILGIKHHYEGLSRFFSHADKELGETLVNAVKSKAVLQANGIIDLYDRMQKSTLQCANDVLLRYLSCLFSLKAVEEILSILEGDPDVIDWDGLCDNRELNLIPGYESGDNATLEQEKIKSQREFVDITQLRHYICTALASVGLIRCSAEKLRNNVVLLSNHIEHCKFTYPNQEAYRQMQTASPCRLGDWIHQGHLESVMRLMKSAVEIAFTHQENAELTPDLLPSAKELAEVLSGILPKFDSNIGPFFVHESLFKASRAFQSLATCKLLTEFIERRAMSYIEVNKPKKTKQQTVLHPLLQRCHDLSNVVREELYKLNDIFIDAVSQINSNKSKLLPSLEPDIYDGVVMSFMQDNYNDVIDAINSSYSASLGSMTGLMAEHFNIIPRRNQ